MKFTSQITALNELIAALRHGREGTLSGARSAFAARDNGRMLAIFARDIGLPVTLGSNGRSQHDLIDPAFQVAVSQCLAPRSMAGALLALRMLLQKFKEAESE